VGLEIDLDATGMGIRSKRYAMVVNDAVIELLNVEAPKKFEVSDAETILTSL
jgi:peroxiredoxin